LPSTIAISSGGVDVLGEDDLGLLMCKNQLRLHFPCFAASDPPTMAATVKAGHPARQAGRIPKQFGRIPPARPDERDAGDSADIQSRDARNRFALTEY
jgi:hypothetical protein